MDMIHPRDGPQQQQQQRRQGDGRIGAAGAANGDGLWKCILYAQNEEDDEIALGQDGRRRRNDDVEEDGAAEQFRGGDVDWLDDTELRLNTSITTVCTDSNARVIRLRMDFDLADAAVDPGNALGVIAEDDEEKEEGEDEFQDTAPDSLLSRRTFPSVTEIYRDTGRQRGISDRLALLQFLEYDAMNFLVHLMDTVYDNDCHRFVWQHTSLNVIDTVTTYSTDQEPLWSSSTNGNVFTHITEPTPNPSTPADYDLGDKGEPRRTLNPRFWVKFCFLNSNKPILYCEHDGSPSAN